MSSIYAAAAGMLDEQRARADKLAEEYRELEAKYAATLVELKKLRGGHSRRLRELEKKVENAGPAFENLKLALRLWKERARTSKAHLREVAEKAFEAGRYEGSAVGPPHETTEAYNERCRVAFEEMWLEVTGAP